MRRKCINLLSPPAEGKEEEGREETDDDLSATH